MLLALNSCFLCVEMLRDWGWGRLLHREVKKLSGEFPAAETGLSPADSGEGCGSNMGNGVCSRRQRRIFQCLLLVTVVCGMMYGGMFSYEIHNQLRRAEAMALKYQQHQESLSAQLQGKRWSDLMFTQVIQVNVKPHSTDRAATCLSSWASSNISEGVCRSRYRWKMKLQKVHVKTFKQSWQKWTVAAL